MDNNNIPRLRKPNSIDINDLNNNESSNDNIQQDIIQVDEISLNAAKEWMSNKRVTNKNSIELKNSFKILNDFFEAKKRADARLEIPINDAVNQANGIRWVDWRIITRLAIGFFLFVNGSSYTRMGIFLAFSIVYYFVEVGLFSYLLQIAAGVEAVAVNPVGQVPGQENNTPVINPNPTFFQRLVILTKEGPRIPETLGIRSDVISFVMAFFMSLVPSWNPNGGEVI